jgi:hypothetical protein
MRAVGKGGAEGVKKTFAREAWIDYPAGLI